MASPSTVASTLEVWNLLQVYACANKGMSICNKKHACLYGNRKIYELMPNNTHEKEIHSGNAKLNQMKHETHLKLLEVCAGYTSQDLVPTAT